MKGTRVDLPADPRGASSFAAIPESPTRGVVVLHEIFGPQPEIERVVERFAAAGYAAVAPDLFGDVPRPLCIARSLSAVHLGHGPELAQIRAARAWLCERTGLAEESVGLIGFCLGGGFALAAGRGWGAVSTNYGDIPPERVMRGLGPTIGCYGARDRVYGDGAPKLEARLRRLGVLVETHTFDEVGHSFLTDGEYGVVGDVTRPLFRVTYDPAVAEEGWRRILSFLSRHLTPRERSAAAAGRDATGATAD